MKKNYIIISSIILLLICDLSVNAQIIDLKKRGSYTTGIFDEGSTEIAAFDPSTNYLYSVNGLTGNVDVLDISDITLPTLAFTIDISAYGAGANSVAAKNGIIVMAVENYVKQDNGMALFFDAFGNYINGVEVGALPDNIVFTPNGNKVLVANEGEPSDDYLVDPLGTVSIIDITGSVETLDQSDVTTIDFTAFDLTTFTNGVRVFGPAAVASNDFEPEYIAVSKNSKLAYVTLQENNAIAIINLQTLSVQIKGLGFKDHSLPGNEIDGTDKNTGITNIANWPVYGMYMPDAIESISLAGGNYLVMANEGDVRDYDGFQEASRISGLVLDSIIFPDSLDLQNENVIGRLNVTTTMGDIDADGDYDELYAFGARSFSIRNTNGDLVYDSGNEIETITNEYFPLNFNCSSTSNTKKGRSDDKGPEPEGLTTAKILDSTYVFVGLERIGGIMVYNITNPVSPYFVQYINDRNFGETPGAGTGGDLGPEGLLFISANNSPSGKNLLVVSYEISGSIGIYETDITCGSNKVLVCYSGITYCVKPSVASLLLASGASYGSCEGERYAYEEMTLDIENEVMAIYPNPANNFVTVTLGGFTTRNINLEIIDITGKVIFTKLISNSITEIIEEEINVSDLPTGVYFISAFDGKITKTDKLVIE